MSTNDRDQLATVTPLSTLQQRYRLEDLLEQRYNTAVLAVEQLSHDIDAADGTFEDLLALENTIEAEFPAAFADAWTRWVTDDAARLHGPGVLVQGCSICQTVAATKGLNLQGPDAA